MKNNLVILLLALCGLCASCKTKFDKQVWSDIENNDLTKTKNPRMSMIDDLKANYLKKGMDKKDVIELLGKPYSDTLNHILPKGMQLPDSLKINYDDVKQSKEEMKKIFAERNEWYSVNQILVPLLKYPIGWSLMDPIFLEIRLNEEKKIVDFWVAQH